jgi:thiol-disulfide isomerase/thioredoxin
MKASSVHLLRCALVSVLSVFLFGTHGVLNAAQPVAGAAGNGPAAQAASDADERAALDDAFRSAESNPQILIKNLEAFLARFPQTTRRDLVLRTICSYAMQANAPDVELKYGQLLLERMPGDPQLLSLLIEAAVRLNDQPSRARGIDYCSRLIAIAETQRDRAAATGVSNNTPEKWAQQIAALYDQRAGFSRDSGDLDKSFADEEKSFAIYPTAKVAERLGDLASAKGDSAQATDDYLTAFAFPDQGTDAAHRRELRRKLGSSYRAQHHSEKGLGDLVLARYDALTAQLGDRLAKDESQNAGRHDPFEFILQRMDGAPLPLANYRGKVIVIDFWATWCGPCRLQGKFVDQIAGSFRSEPDAVFLSLNTDQDRGGVQAYLRQEGWTLPVAYAQGLDHLFAVTELPTLLIFNREGRVVFRQNGLDPGSFVEEVSKHLRETLRGSRGQ